MNSSLYGESLIRTLKAHLRANRSLAKRPIFVFCCGGNESIHRSRKALSDYIMKSTLPELQNVFCIRAENISEIPGLQALDLLTQEAIIADVSDSLILFAESEGSYCELGAFSVLPHIQSILTVVEDKEHSASKSFLNNGPIELIRSLNYPLSRVFITNLDCPMESAEFVSFVTGIRSHVRDSDNNSFNKYRKTLNKAPDDIQIGPLVHELLDLVYLLAPITFSDLQDLYYEIKGYDRNSKIVSTTVQKDMKRQSGNSITFEQVADFMCGMGMIRKTVSGDSDAYCTDYKLENFFMFKNASDRSFQNAIARSILSKRTRSLEGSRNVYRRFD